MFLTEQNVTIIIQARKMRAITNAGAFFHGLPEKIHQTGDQLDDVRLGQQRPLGHRRDHPAHLLRHRCGLHCRQRVQHVHLGLCHQPGYGHCRPQRTVPGRVRRHPWYAQKAVHGIYAHRCCLGSRAFLHAVHGLHRLAGSGEQGRGDGAGALHHKHHRL